MSFTLSLIRDVAKMNGEIPMARLLETWNEKVGRWQNKPDSAEAPRQKPPA